MHYRQKLGINSMVQNLVLSIKDTFPFTIFRKFLINSFYKKKIIKTYAKQFQIETLVETGTYLGDMVQATQRSFKDIYSIELDPTLYDNAKVKFKKFSHIHLLQGDSGEVLKKLLPSIKKRCLFWLDAHYSGGITAKGSKETPVLDELESIFTHSVPNHVILIDDARCFKENKNYPTLLELKNFVSQFKKDWIVTEEKDIIRIYEPIKK